MSSINVLVKTLCAYRPTQAGVKALDQAASEAGINFHQALVEAGFGKFKSSPRGVNPSMLGSKAPALYPGQEEVVAALFMKIERQNPVLAGEFAAVWFHIVADEVPIYGKQTMV